VNFGLPINFVVEIDTVVSLRAILAEFCATTLTKRVLEIPINSRGFKSYAYSFRFIKIRHISCACRYDVQCVSRVLKRIRAEIRTSRWGRKKSLKVCSTILFFPSAFPQNLIYQICIPLGINKDMIEKHINKMLKYSRYVQITVK